MYYRTFNQAAPMVIGTDGEAYAMAFFGRGISDKQREKKHMFDTIAKYGALRNVPYFGGNNKRIGNAGAYWESERSFF